jgi:hypothetical protein
MGIYFGGEKGGGERTWPNFAMVLSGLTVSSSERKVREVSYCSIQPPGFRWLGIHCQLVLFIQRKFWAGIHARVRLLVESWPVRHASVQRAQVYEVEIVPLECPVVVEVFNFEADVGWDPVGLDGGEVGADDGGGGEFICEVYGPDAGACSEIKDFLASGLACEFITRL